MGCIMRQHFEIIALDSYNEISDYLTGPELSHFASTSRRTNELLKTTLINRRTQERTQQLLSAVFMGNEDLTMRIIHTNPEILFKKGTYRVPILDADGEQLKKSEQIYYDVTPLELSLYTGDWSMWKHGILCVSELSRNPIFAQKIVDAMRLVKQGGPDLVKMNRELSLIDLENFSQDVGIVTINHPLLSNPDGILCIKRGVRYDFYYANKQTQTIEAITPDLSNPVNAAYFEQLIYKIDHEMPTNSSLRTSDQEHALIASVFNKQLVRHGIHYELNGIHFHDTHDGCYRLMNAYAKYYELQRGGNASKENCMTIIGRAQRNAMPYDIQLMLDQYQIDQSHNGYYLADKGILQLSPCKRDNQFSFSGQAESAYPLRENAGIGFDCVLSRGTVRRSVNSRYERELGQRPYKQTSSCTGTSILHRVVDVELAECNQIANLKIEMLNLLLPQVEENARPKSETSTSCCMGFFQRETLSQLREGFNQAATEMTIDQIAARFSGSSSSNS